MGHLPLGDIARSVTSRPVRHQRRQGKLQGSSKKGHCGAAWRPGDNNSHDASRHCITEAKVNALRSIGNKRGLCHGDIVPAHCAHRASSPAKVQASTRRRVSHEPAAPTIACHEEKAAVPGSCQVTNLGRLPQGPSAVDHTGRQTTRYQLPGCRAQRHRAANLQSSGTGMGARRWSGGLRPPPWESHLQLRPLHV